MQPHALSENACILYVHVHFEWYEETPQRSILSGVLIEMSVSDSRVQYRQSMDDVIGVVR